MKTVLIALSAATVLVATLLSGCDRRTDTTTTGTTPAMPASAASR